MLQCVEGDMGWVTPRIPRQIEMLRLWNRLVSLGEERLPRQVCNVMMNKGHPWLSEIKKLFNMLNVNDVLQNNLPILNFHSFEKFAIKSLMSKYVSNDWLTTVSIKPKLELYQQYNTDIWPSG